MGKIVRGGKFEQEILMVLLENFLHRVFPTLEHLDFGFGLHVHVMGFIGNQDNFMLAEVFVRDGVFFFSRQVGMEFLNGGKANADFVLVCAFKIINGGNAHAAVSDVNIRIEKIFDGIGIEKIILCLFDDVGGVDEEQEVSIALFIQVKNHPRHDERFAASRCHIEKKMHGKGLVGIIVLVAMKETRKGFDLVAAQFKPGIQIQFHRIGKGRLPSDET